MNILVTGGTGFLGSFLTRRLRAEGHHVVPLGSRNADLTNPASLDRFNQISFDTIYHLAAWTQAGDFCLHHPGEQWIKNQFINSTVLAWWQKRQPRARLIAMGTSCSYPCDRELKEEHYLLGQPIDSLFTYAMTKRMLLVGMQSLHKQFGLSYLCLVPSTLYGPGYHTDGRQMHFIFDLIRKFLKAQRDGIPVILWGDGQQRRELVFVDDFVDIMLTLVGRAQNTIINIGAGEEFTIQHFAEIICLIIGYDPTLIRYDPSKYVGARSKCLSVERLRSYVPHLRLTTLKEGLARTIAWFREHRELLENQAA